MFHLYNHDENCLNSSKIASFCPPPPKRMHAFLKQGRMKLIWITRLIDGLDVRAQHPEEHLGEEHAGEDALKLMIIIIFKKNEKWSKLEWVKLDKDALYFLYLN